MITFIQLKKRLQKTKNVVVDILKRFTGELCNDIVGRIRKSQVHLMLIKFIIDLHAIQKPQMQNNTSPIRISEAQT